MEVIQHPQVSGAFYYHVSANELQDVKLPVVTNTISMYMLVYSVVFINRLVRVDGYNYIASLVSIFDK